MTPAERAALLVGLYVAAMRAPEDVRQQEEARALAAVADAVGGGA